MKKQNLKLVKSSKDNQQPPAKPTPAEQAEAQRFKNLIAAKAARRAMIARIMADLNDIDQSAA